MADEHNHQIHAWERAQQITNCSNATLAVLAVLDVRVLAPGTLPRDLRRIIARMVWETRDIEDWGLFGMPHVKRAWIQ